MQLIMFFSFRLFKPSKQEVFQKVMKGLSFVARADLTN